MNFETMGKVGYVSMLTSVARVRIIGLKDDVWDRDGGFVSRGNEKHMCIVMICKYRLRQETLDLTLAHLNKHSIM